jgi:hypothetical protein
MDWIYDAGWEPVVGPFRSGKWWGISSLAARLLPSQGLSTFDCHHLSLTQPQSQFIKFDYI